VWPLAGTDLAAPVCDPELHASEYRAREGTEVRSMRVGPSLRIFLRSGALSFVLTFATLAALV